MGSFPKGWVPTNAEAVEAATRLVVYLPGMNFHRFVPPEGFLSPNIVEVMLIGSVEVCRRAFSQNTMASLSDVACAALGVESSRVRWPMYALKEELADALLHTRAPGDMTWAELEWPIETATFLLPDVSEMNDHFLSPGNPIAITVGRFLSPYPMPPIGKNFVVTDSFNFAGNGLRVLMDVLYFDSVANSLLAQTMVARMDDSLDLSGQAIMPQPPGALGAMALNDQDMIRQRRVVEMAANILAFMASGYEPIPIPSAGPTLVRPASPKHKRDALFAVRWLGQAYRRIRVGPSLGGHHASPIVHWRCGHFRSQPYGPKRALRKPIWIQPVMVHPATTEEPVPA